MVIRTGWKVWMVEKSNTPSRNWGLFWLVLERVDLCCSIFVLFERAFIAALDVWLSNLSEYQATMRKVRSKEPLGSV